MEYDSEVRKLSEDFYADYPENLYPEILRKDERPYTCLLIDVHEDYLICLPFRTMMNHPQGFRFLKSKRASQFHSGLDYSKLALITDPSYIDQRPAVVDNDEFKIVVDNLDKIVGEVIQYIDDYAAHISGTRPLHPREYARRYQFSTLPYFHGILGL